VIARIWPHKTPTQNGLFMGAPGTFIRSKSRLRPMPGNKVGYGPNGPANQALGQSASMLTKTVNRGRHCTKLRSALYTESCGVWRIWPRIWRVYGLASCILRYLPSYLRFVRLYLPLDLKIQTISYFIDTGAPAGASIRIFFRYIWIFLRLL
jgi:hypothetical protein